MKLELWLKKNDNGKSDCFDITIGQEKVLTGEIEKLHVIGTCGECKYGLESEVAAERAIVCDNEEAHSEGLVVIDGCVHFEEKGKIKGNSIIKKELKC